MPYSERYRCLNCGSRFEVELLTREEAEEARRRNQPTYPIACPDCRRASVEKGWG